MKEVADDLRRTVRRAAERLAAIPAEDATYFVRDYVAHLNHHLAQIPS